MIIGVLITYFLWLAVFRGQTNVFGYGRADMFTYIILLTFLQGVVLSTQTQRIASEINTGDLSNFLIKPINFFGLNLARDLTDKFINTFFSIGEIAFLYYLLKPPIVLQTNIYWLSLFALTVILAALLYFEINLLLSFIGFWSKETWAPRFIFYILVTFLAGTYFPLDIFPQPIFNVLQLLPFTYIIFFPLKIYLGTPDPAFLIKGFIVIFSWIIILGFFLLRVWRQGLKIYTSEGR